MEPDRGNGGFLRITSGCTVSFYKGPTLSKLVDASIISLGGNPNRRHTQANTEATTFSLWHEEGGTEGAEDVLGATFGSTADEVVVSLSRTQPNSVFKPPTSPNGPLRSFVKHSAKANSVPDAVFAQQHG